MRQILLKAFPVLIILNTILSVGQWSRFPVGNTFIDWTINALMVGLIVWYKRTYFRPLNKSDYTIVSIYFIWMLIGVIRGMFVAENYWEWKQWAAGSFTLGLPLFVYIFSSPYLLRKTLQRWIKYALPLFLVVIWFITSDAYQFYLGPVLLLSCFLPVLKRKWQLIFIGLLLLMMFADFGARSQVIKSAMAISMSIAFLFAKYFSQRILKVLHWTFYILPLLLLLLGVTGIFNLFQGLSKNEGKYVEKKVVNGVKEEDDLSADTRTFIYIEVIESAIKHNYVIWGRTPARGNDSAAFGSYNAENLKTGKYERHSNEVCFPNVFTWLGLVGMILYCLIYLKSSYLAAYKSNNIFMKLLGVFIAFRFAYGWVEDFNRFDIMNISLWMMIAMGFSEKFRRMNNRQFQFWIKSIFINRNKRNEGTVVVPK